MLSWITKPKYTESQKRELSRVRERAYNKQKRDQEYAEFEKAKEKARAKGSWAAKSTTTKAKIVAGRVGKLVDNARKQMAPPKKQPVKQTKKRRKTRKGRKGTRRRQTPMKMFL